MSKTAGTLGLEYPLLFGLPENKTEVLGGKMRVVWPFADGPETVLAFGRWVDRLERWRECPRRPLGGPSPAFEVGGITIRCHKRRIEMRVPMDVDTLLALDGSFWHPQRWGQPARAGKRYESFWRRGDIRMHLWSAFGEIQAKAGGTHCRGDVMVTPDTSLSFDQDYYAPEAPMGLIGGDFPEGAPCAIAEVLSGCTREADYGPRSALLHRAGVRHVWLLDPLQETVDVFAWQAPAYALEGTFAADQELRPAFCPGLALPVDSLFHDRRRRWNDDDDDDSEDEERHEPEWLLPPDRRLGLEHLMLLGHPARRYETWRDSSPCVLAFGSPAEGRHRLRQFAADAGRWSGTSQPAPLQLPGDAEAIRAGLFQFTRRENRVYLDVAVDAAQYRRMLEAMCDDEVWRDWDGDDEDDPDP